MSIKNFFKHLVNLGVTDRISRQESKSTRILNFACVLWIPLNLVFIVEDLLFKKDPAANIFTFLLTIVFLFFVLFLHHKKLYVLSKLVFMIMSTTHFLAFAIYLEPRAFLEYFLLLPPVFSLFFFNNRLLSFMTWVISYVLFTYTMTHFNHYPTINFQHTANLALFFSIYIAFAYFKQVNMKSEKSLELQRYQLENQNKEAIEANRKIEKQRLELESLNKFQAHFWVNLSHEIRTPLTLIKGSANKLLKTPHSVDVIDHYERIEYNANRIHSLVDNIMDLAKMKSNKFDINLGKYDILDVCKKTVISFEPLFTEKNIHYNIINKSDASSVFCNVDKLFFDRALGNLLLNAITYTPNKGEIELVLDQSAADIQIHVKDNGCGIPENELDQIFEEFYRAKNVINNSGGSGIGLSFSKEVIELHGGTLCVNSSEGNGAEFIITLPTDINLSEDIILSKKTEYFPPSKDANSILLVEDNEDMRNYIKNTLIGYHIIEACNGAEALNLINQIKPDLIVTDYMMPLMNGYEFVQQLRENGFDIPVIVLTARVDNEAKIDFLRLGLDDYLTKPFNEEELKIRVNHSLHNNALRAKFNEVEQLEALMKNDEVMKLKEIVETHITSSLFSVMELAELLSVSEKTLQRKIKSWCGMTANNFIQEVRLQKAMELYRKKEVNSIKELTLEVGFSNTSHFVKLFEKRFGKKPTFKTL